MEKRILYILCALAVLQVGCQAIPATTSQNIYLTDANKNGTEDIYEKKGMEVSAVATQMAKLLYDTMYENLPAEDTKMHAGRLVKIVTFPRIAITSFVDMDTYENPGYLGREMAEIMVHELNRRNIEVIDYKVRKGLSVTKEGDLILSRDYKKIAATANVSYILTGTITRNRYGVVLSARVINMENHVVLGSATGFIPYDYLPYCYRTAEKNCSIASQNSFITDADMALKWDREQRQAKQALIEKRKQQSLGGIVLDKTNYKYFEDTNTIVTYDGVVIPATLGGNYKEYLEQKKNPHIFGPGDNPVIYPAQTYEHNGFLIRDINKQSQYDRLYD